MSCVKVGEHFTDWFKVDRGLQRGCNLSLFNLFINDLADTIHRFDSVIQCGGVHILMYADDIVLLTDSEKKTTGNVKGFIHIL